MFETTLALATVLAITAAGGAYAIGGSYTGGAAGNNPAGGANTDVRGNTNPNARVDTGYNVDTGGRFTNGPGGGAGANTHNTRRVNQPLSSVTRNGSSGVVSTNRLSNRGSTLNASFNSSMKGYNR